MSYLGAYGAKMNLWHHLRKGKHEFRGEHWGKQWTFEAVEVWKNWKNCTSNPNKTHMVLCIQLKATEGFVLVESLLKQYQKIQKQNFAKSEARVQISLLLNQNFNKLVLHEAVKLNTMCYQVSLGVCACFWPIFTVCNLISAALCSLEDIHWTSTGLAWTACTTFMSSGLNAERP